VQRADVRCVQELKAHDEQIAAKEFMRAGSTAFACMPRKRP
jgi:exonuclease III